MLGPEPARPPVADRSAAQRPAAQRANGPAPNAVPPGSGPAPIAAHAQRIGRLISDQEVVLHMPAGQTEWRRLASGGTFNSGDKLLVLPTFRPTLTLASGVTLQLVPETMIQIEGTDHGVPVVRLDYGRMVLMTTGKADVKIELALGKFSGLLNFDDAEATVGVEVRPYHLPGANPETTQPQRAIAIYGVNGVVSWTPAGDKAEKLQAPSRITLATGRLPTADEHKMPKWISAEPISPLEVRASQTLNEALGEKRPVSQVLLEMSAHRREENRSLAARSLALIDEFEPFDVLLNDTEERSVWPVQIESLQAALAHGPSVAAKVRAAFEKQRGKDGTALYRMLWGYNKDQLAAGAATQLVEYLDHDNLDFRVLSFYALKALTGTTFNYRPEQSAASRQQPIRRWREQLKDGLIAPKGAPACDDLTAGRAGPDPTCGTFGGAGQDRAAGLGQGVGPSASDPGRALSGPAKRNPSRIRSGGFQPPRVFESWRTVALPGQCIPATTLPRWRVGLVWRFGH